jgi:adenosylcobinamide-phosphate synthase
MNGLMILSSFFFDLLFGDPHWFPHPVRGIGWLVQRGEALLRRFAKTPRAEKTAGVVLVILIISLVYFTSQFLILSAFKISPHIGFIVSALMAYTTLAARDLSDSARRVLARLDVGDIVNARKELSMIVGRDTESLDEKEITRAVVETVAENTSDGVIAPLFYMAIGGPALAMAYKAVNTLDSMIGYKHEKYVNFGWAAARLDDIANYIPARITAALMCVASDLLRWFQAFLYISNFVSIRDNSWLTSIYSSFRKPNSTFMSSWRIVLRDGRNHPSPNSGYPEAAMAGALGIRLGGPSTYAGVVNLKSFIGDARNVLDKKSIEKSIWLMYCATLLAVVAAALGAAAINFNVKLIFS